MRDAYQASYTTERETGKGKIEAGDKCTVSSFRVPEYSIRTLGRQVRGHRRLRDLAVEAEELAGVARRTAQVLEFENLGQSIALKLKFTKVIGNALTSRTMATIE
mgnify:FL=1